MRSRRILRAGAVRGRIWIAYMHRETRMLGASCAMQCWETRMDGGNRRMSERGRNLHWMPDAWFSRQIHAVHEPAAGFIAVFERGDDLWPCDSRFAPVHAVLAQQRAILEDPFEGLSVTRRAK